MAASLAFMSLMARGQLGLREDGRHSPQGPFPEPLGSWVPGRISPVSALPGSPDQRCEDAVGFGTVQEALTSAPSIRSHPLTSLTFSTVQSLASSEEQGQQEQGSGGDAVDVPARQRAASQQRRNNSTFLGPAQVRLLSCWSGVFLHRSLLARAPT